MEVDAEDVERVEIVENVAKPHSIPIRTAMDEESVPHKPKESEEDSRWKITIQQCIQSIVSIRFIVPKTFDTWQPGSYSATGFIVDAEQGLIMTNKHVLTDAPWIGKACFRNSEEAACFPIYRDPVHDFGFLRFDPSSINFMQLKALELAPEEARVGLSIRLPGSDAGEKLAILSGILARLDRPAAHYGTGTYNDFNTFYLQSSSNSSGGSSGSPIINLAGKVVAINAGGSTNAASSFFLPLERAVVALQHLQRGEPVPRGTLQTEFVQRSYDDVRRLGLPLEVESELRKVNEDLSGALSVRHVVPNGPAWGHLQTGDVVIEVNGQTLNHFVALAEVLDASVGKEVEFVVFRGRKFVQVTLPVQDLHSITPDRYVEIGGSIVHSLSFQLARGYLHPVGAVYVADAGHMLSLSGVPSNSIITAVAHQSTPNLQEFCRVMGSIPDNKRAPIRYYKLSKKHVEMTKIITMDKRWSRFREAVRNDETGVWDYRDLDNVEVVVPMLSKAAARYIPIPSLGDGHYNKVASKLQRSFVTIEYRAPFGIDGVNGKWSEGVGCILDSELGIVMADRSVIITPLGRCTVTFANQLVVPGDIIWLHPTQNFAFIKYDPALVIDKIHPPPAGLTPSTAPSLRPGEEVALVTMNINTHAIRSHKTEVKSRGFFLFSDAFPPKFRAMSFDEAITLHKGGHDECGVIADFEGRVRGFWNKYENSWVGQSYEQEGMLAQCLRGVQRGLSNKAMIPHIRAVDYEWTETYFWKARELGLDDVWFQRMVSASHIAQRSITANLDDIGTEELDDRWDETQDSQIVTPKYSIVTVRRVPAQPTDDRKHGLREGDLVLTVNKRMVTAMRDLCQVVSGSNVDTKDVVLHILRDGQEMDVQVPTKLLSGNAQVNVVHWAGCVVQQPHRAIYFHVKHLPRGVYISLLYSGTPAQRDGLSATWFITEIDGKKTENLEAFLGVVIDANVTESHGNITIKEAAATKSYKVKLVSLENVQKVVTLEVSGASMIYSPTWRVSKLMDGEVEMSVIQRSS